MTFTDSDDTYRSAADTPPPDFDTPEELLSLAREMIRIPSVTGSEAEVAVFASDWMSEAGLDVETLEVEADRPNVIATIGSGQGPLYVMNGHLDIVPVPEDEEWEHPPFEAVVADGRLHGRGSFDMKGGCASLMWAAARLAEQKDNLQGTLQVHLVCDEEKGGNAGSGAIAQAISEQRLPRPAGILSPELSWFHLRTAERGIFQFRLRFKGRSSHTARARAGGLNAIAVASRGVLALEKHIDRFHPDVGFPVLSVNRIEAGRSNNQVPSTCTVLVDRRIVPGETAENVIEEVRSALDGLNEQTEDGRFLPVEYELITEADDLMAVVPANMTDREEPVVQALWDEAESLLGYRPPLYTDWGGATDAHWFRSMGIPMVTMGPTGAGAHAANEYTDVASLGAIGEIYRRTVARLLGVTDD
ncbi:M20 family metallopeptidase [Gemmatimonadota bacterium]